MYHPVISSEKLWSPKSGNFFNFLRIDHHHQELDSLRYFFTDPVYVHTLGEKYPENSAEHLKIFNQKISFFVTEFYGDPDDLPG